MKKKISFRADASAQIGYGHFIRTLALADMLKDDFDCVFYTAEPSPYQIGELQKVCHYVPLSDSTKFEDFLACLSGAEIVVLDNYFYTEEYQQQIKKKGCKLVCIDDMHDKHYYADIVINHAYGAKKEDYSLEPYTQLCLGLNYALLRKPFLESGKGDNNRNSILICYGGADVYNLTCRTIQYLETELEQYHVDVIVGDAFKYLDVLDGIVNQHSNIEIHKTVPAFEMAELMQRAEVAFLPASSLLWEAIFSGCKVLYGYYVENQMDICRNVGSNQHLGLTYVGDLRDINAEKLQCIFGKVNDGINRNQFQKPDVRAHFNALFISEVTVREAKIEDARIYFDWANDPMVRQMAFHTEPILWDNHIKWFSSKVSSEKSHLLLCYYQMQPIGQVRFDIIKGSKAEIDISIAKEYRGKGFGKAMLKSAIEYEHCMKGINSFVSEVKVNNASSNKMFLACGFELLCSSNNVNYYSFIS